MLTNTKDNIRLNKIGNNIKKTINNMRKKIEKTNIRRMSNSLSTENIKHKLRLNSSLKFIKIKDKKNKKTRTTKPSPK